MSDVCVIEAEAGVVDGQVDRAMTWRIDPERGEVSAEELEKALTPVTSFLRGALSPGSGVTWVAVNAWWEHRGT